MSITTPTHAATTDDPTVIFSSWLAEFVRAIEAQSHDDLTELLAENATWREYMSFEWDFSNEIGRAPAVDAILSHSQKWQATDFRLCTEQLPILFNGDVYGYFDFKTKDRENRGFALLTRDRDGFVAKTLSVQVVQLQAYPELAGEHRKQGKVHGYVPGRTRWSEDREREREFRDEEPAVVVLGAGHNGLGLAARLGALGVSTLVFEKEARVGDQWRKRYPSLALHSPVHGDDMPYFQWPKTWTAHTPKDKLADWFESYANLLDINVWTSTTLLKADYDEDAQRWNLFVRRGGSIRELHPRHFVVAGGLFGAPKIPEIKGLDTFSGLSMHSDSFQDGIDWTGKRVVVVGAGVSGHELAHDLHEHGAHVTMVQRSETWVVRFDTNNQLWSPLFTDEMALGKDFADQAVFATPNLINDASGRELVKRAEEIDQDLIKDLESQGFRIKRGPDVTGVPGAHMSGKDAYQIDIGASQLIADGSIAVKQGVEIEEIDKSAVRFTDGAVIDDVDLLIFATGYHQFWGHIKPALGTVGAKIDQVYGRAADNEYANTWRRSDQPGLWFATGFIRMVRLYSTFTATLIKAIEVGLQPIDPSRTEAEKSGEHDH